MTLEYYNLEYYADNLHSIGLLDEATLFDQETTEIKGLEFDSTKVKPGTLFVCKGQAFKEKYLVDAIEKGAVAYIAEEKYEIDSAIPYLLVSDIRKTMPVLANIFYNSPSDKLKIIGVGGTKGKTTTTYFVKSILDEYLKTEGKLPAGIISSVIVYDGINQEESKNTTPEAMELQKHLANAVEAGLEYLVMEVSSQGLKYHRTAGIIFDVSIFLNISEDHISPIEHPNFEDYRASKAKMFGQTRELVINHETQEAEYMLRRAQEAEHFSTFSLVSESADYFVHDIETIGLLSKFRVQAENFDEEYSLALPGEFNIENAVAAIATTDLLGIPQKHAVSALKETRVPGRMEMFITEDEEIIGIADYAHNYLSFEKLATSVKKAYPDYKIISIFGAAGGKALGRREELGTIGGRYSDLVILTEEDPNFEDVQSISEEIAQYVKKEGAPYKIINNREEAIIEAFNQVNGKTMILALAKGDEDFMKVRGQSVPMTPDTEILKSEINRYNTERR